MSNWISVDTLPERKTDWVSDACVFKTKRNQWEGYYHFGDQKWVTIQPPYHKGRFYRYITEVKEWCYKRDFLTLQDSINLDENWIN